MQNTENNFTKNIIFRCVKNFFGVGSRHYYYLIVAFVVFIFLNPLLYKKRKRSH
jgi:hypothetical protein